MRALRFAFGSVPSFLLLHVSAGEAVEAVLGAALPRLDQDFSERKSSLEFLEFDFFGASAHPSIPERSPLAAVPPLVPSDTDGRVQCSRMGVAHGATRVPELT
jgi:hypothetical protein